MSIGDIKSHPPLTEVSRFVNLDNLRKTGKCKRKVFANAIYEGELKERKCWGKGIIVYKSGRRYEGDWVNDKRHGKGYEIFASGSTYEGDYMNGYPSGRGIYVWKNGEVYDGEWLTAKKHGDGVWKGTEGDSYIGEWRNNKAEGYGIHYWKNGDKYEGEWKDCLKHGNGTDLLHNGDSYSGQYKFGKPCGYGQYFWKNGSIYSGQFVDGVKQGFGRWRKSKDYVTNLYEGQYANDKKEGFGIFKWVSGNIYIGHYKNDEREGIGQMIWTDGSVYIGEWRGGIQHGYGRMYFPDGTAKEGLFDKNVFKGPKGLDSYSVPMELLEKDFEIMNYAGEMQFSEEILGRKSVDSRVRNFGFTTVCRERSALNKSVGDERNRPCKVFYSAKDSEGETNQESVYLTRKRPKRRRVLKPKKPPPKGEWIPAGRSTSVNIGRVPGGI
eukprot:TRINITY_DN6485_c0_g2_i3.p1 TRINITY_DN6485_c0_g2~~TRINITY_DN6485_c0_g2_i3.p1  ORF type:complete len:438 (-),score=102.39 TRINITY_DN6485_c0_g2_i3:99-1412(-)